MTDLRYAIVHLEPNELGLVYSSFRESTLLPCGRGRRSTLWPNATKSQHDVLAAAKMDGWVGNAHLALSARSAVDSSVTLGWAMATKPGPRVVVLFAFVKPMYRRAGVARSLVEACLTRLGGSPAQTWEYVCPLRKGLNARNGVFASSIVGGDGRVRP